MTHGMRATNGDRTSVQVLKNDKHLYPREPRAARERRGASSSGPAKRRLGLYSNNQEVDCPSNALTEEDGDFSATYSVDELLGEGASGRVELIYNYKLKEEFALKTVPRRSSDKYLETEIVNHSLQRHPHIVRLGDVFVTEDNICIQMEYANAGTLLDRVRREGLLSENEARWYFQQLILALDYSHRCGVCHRDVKLENCVLHLEPGAPCALLKLCDFGFSKSDHHSAPQSKVGTLSAMAPEIISAEQKVYDGPKVDLWSAGVALYTMVSGERPFNVDRHPDAEHMTMLDRCLYLEELMLGQRYPTPICSSGCRDLITGLLKPNPQERLSMAQVLRHPWFLKGLPGSALEMDDRYCSLPKQDPEEQQALVRQLLA